MENGTLAKTKPNPSTLRRVEQLSFILYRYITDMVYGGEIDQEILNSGVQISKVSIKS
jgi:hypothetical protein